MLIRSQIAIICVKKVLTLFHKLFAKLLKYFKSQIKLHFFFILCIKNFLLIQVIILKEPVKLNTSGKRCHF